jgi:formylglycine-generating enzyme required for sulfatase activity
MEPNTDSPASGTGSHDPRVRWEKFLATLPRQKTRQGISGLRAIVLSLAGVAFAIANGASAQSPAQSRPAFEPTVPNAAPPPASAPAGMVWIPGGEFSMGSEAAAESLCAMPGVTRDALPVHRVYVDGFGMDATEVTNGQFAEFVKATGYVTIAEKNRPPAPSGCIQSRREWARISLRWA